ncbi:RICIN domain-containing protein [Streptomyces sp. NPDC018964]|uniref:RICIN domain-containing protein n=1 Tax=Streptomyces sp. NPDC018964 TaxID=3365058 RepID=UPI00378B5576
MLAGAAMAGALLIAVPLLMMATGGDEDDEKKVSTDSVSDTVIDGGGSPAGAFVAESPSPVKKKEPKEKTEEKPKEKPKAAGEPSVAEPPSAPPASGTAGTKSEKSEKSAGKKAPSSLPAVLTKVLIRNNTNGTCVDIPNFASGTVDGPIIHADCNGAPDDNQLWNLEKRYSGAGPGGVPLFQIRNVMDSMCLDLPGYGSVGSETKVTEFPCDGTKGDNQLWWLDKQPDGKFWIRNAAGNNMCLDSYGVDDERRDLVITPCAPENQNNHEWAIARP